MKLAEIRQALRKMERELKTRQRVIKDKETKETIEQLLYYFIAALEQIGDIDEPARK